MKKLLNILCITIAVIFTLSLFSGCTPNNTTEPTPTPTEEASAPTPTPTATPTVAPTPSPTPKPVLTGDITPYYDFLKNFSANITENINGYNIFLKDLDNNGIEELCITFPPSKGGGINLKVYTHTTEVQELGELHFASGSTQLLYADSYPGIVQYNVGGGRDWYKYVTIINGELSHTYIWNKDYAGAAEEMGLSPIEKFTEDEKLISESGKAFENNQRISRFPLSELK